MKATKYIIAFAAMVAAMPSCTNTADIEGSIGQEITIKAKNESSPWTRTFVQNGGTAVLWDTSEEIKIFYKSTGSRFVSTNSSASATAEFTGTLNVVLGINEGVGSGETYLWGLYPYRSDATSDGNSVTTTLPNEQEGCAGTFAKGTNITVSKSDSFVMPFYNVCGGVRFSLTHTGVKSVTLEGNAGETLAGRIKIGWSGGVPAIQSVSDGSTAITLTAPNGGTFQTGKWYYIIAVPGSLSKGYKLTFSTGTETAVKQSSTAVSIARGQFGSITEADSGLTYSGNGGNEPVGNIIIFADPAAKYACVEKFDTNGDGELSEAEAAAVTSIAGLFKDWNAITSFEEIRYFTSLTDLGNAFQGKTKLLSLTIPSFITKLNSYEFDGCTALKQVTLPLNITSIPSYSFRNCSSLTSLEIPSAVKSIGTYSFYGCESLTGLAIPSGVTSFGSYAFCNCSKMTRINIPNGVTSIPNYCFCGCSSLADLLLPEGLTSIGDYALYNAIKTWKYELPGSIKSIGDYCFSGIINIIIPSPELVTISPATFSDDSGVFIFVPESLVDKYKHRTNWSHYQFQIYNISQYRNKEDYTMLKEGSAYMGSTIKWSACNLGATKPEEYGGHYQWAGLQDVTSESINLDWSNCPYHTGTSSSTGWIKYIPFNEPSYWSGMGGPDNKIVLDSEDDIAHIKLGGMWRMPTYEECSSLSRQLWIWESYNGINGYKVYSPSEGKIIFLPAAGRRYGTKLENGGSSGYYWTSSLYTDSSYWSGRAIYTTSSLSACNMHFGSTRLYGGSDDRFLGLSVRPVSD